MTRSPATERLHLACFRERVECPLHRALAGAKRERQGRARPRLAVGEEGEHRGMLLFDGGRQHDDLACAARYQRKALLRRAHVCQRPKLHAKPRDFHAQPCAMRFIGVLAADRHVQHSPVPFQNLKGAPGGPRPRRPPLSGTRPPAGAGL